MCVSSAMNSTAGRVVAGISTMGLSEAGRAVVGPKVTNALVSGGLSVAADVTKNALRPRALPPPTTPETAPGTTIPLATPASQSRRKNVTDQPQYTSLTIGS